MLSILVFITLARGPIYGVNYRAVAALNLKKLVAFGIPVLSLDFRDEF